MTFKQNQFSDFRYLAARFGAPSQREDTVVLDCLFSRNLDTCSVICPECVVAFQIPNSVHWTKLAITYSAV